MSGQIGLTGWPRDHEGPWPPREPGYGQIQPTYMGPGEPYSVAFPRCRPRTPSVRSPTAPTSSVLGAAGPGAERPPRGPLPGGGVDESAAASGDSLRPSVVVPGRCTGWELQRPRLAGQPAEEQPRPLVAVVISVPTRGRWRCRFPVTKGTVDQRVSPPAPPGQESTAGRCA